MLTADTGICVKVVNQKPVILIPKVVFTCNEYLCKISRPAPKGKICYVVGKGLITSKYMLKYSRKNNNNN